MNIAHIIGRKRNRLNRCKKRLSDKELGGVQRNQIVQRLAELEAEFVRTK
jgi:hypothetical protein